MEPTRDRLYEALRNVRDPELDEDVVTLGMVGSLSASDGRVDVTLQLPTPGYPGRERMLNDAREALEGVEGVERVDLSVSAEVRAANKKELPGIKNVLAVGSGKGGVGKSTVAANLAAALALDGAAVGLLDADIYGPSQAKMFAVEGKRLMADDDKQIIPLKSHGVKLISIANLVEDGQALTWRGPILHGTLNQMLNQTVWGDLDYLVVDLPPGTGDVQLSLSQLVSVTGAVLVTTPQEMALADVRRAHTMMRKTHIPVLGVIENMSWYELPDGTRDFIFGSGGAEAFAAKEQIPLLGSIPITSRMRETGDTGRPVVLADAENPSALALRRAARAVAGRVAMQNTRSLPVL